MRETVDIIIIGGGPVGLYGAYYAGMRGLSVKIIEALPELGGQLTNLYPLNDINNVAGLKEIRAKELIGNLKEQAFQYDPEVVLNQKVIALLKKSDHFEVVTETENHTARTVMITIGPGAFIPASLFTDSIEDQESRGIFLDPKDIGKLTGQKVLICGGKQEAVGWAIEARGVCQAVTTITHFDLYEDDDARFDPEMSMVDVMSPYYLKDIHGKGQVDAATIKHNVTGEEIRLKVDAVLMARGQLTNMEPVKTWGAELTDNHIAVDEKMSTSVPGLFAAGDAISYAGKVNTINAGAAEAAIAANNAKAFIDPTASVQPEYSAK